MQPDKRQIEMARIRRRDFLRNASAATLSALAAGPARRLIAGEEKKITPTADRMILIWMAGGMAHTDTFDPHAYVPFTTGMERRRIGTIFPSIDTAVDGLKISKGLENIAKVMDRATLIRSFKPEATSDALPVHEPHQFHWHTGYFPPVGVAAPHMGAVLARTLGPMNGDMPPFIDVGQTFPVDLSIRAFHTAGFLGAEFGPMMIPMPADAAGVLRPPAGVTPQRFERRQNLFKSLADLSPVGSLGSDYQRDSLIRSMDDAYRLMNSPAAKAFDITLEPRASYDKYNTSRFGQGCLLTRRLIEAGARFVEITTDFYPFIRWDCHLNGLQLNAEMKQTIDAPVARLILDLEERGLLDRTLVVLATEFSRQTMDFPEKIQNVANYGLHNHFGDACSVVVFGGGFKKGFVYGATSDEPPCPIVDKPIGIPDLHATLYHALGIPPNLAYVTEDRPFHVTKDGLGKPVMELLA